MKKMNRMKTILTCAAISMLCAGTAIVGWNAATASAEEIPTPDFYVAGGSLKYVKAQDSGNGIRYAIAVKQEMFNSWLNEEGTDFAETITVGGVVAPADLFEGDLTADTVLSQGTVATYELKYENFSDEDAINEYAGYQIAYIVVTGIEVANYNRTHAVVAYYENEANEEGKVYSQSGTGCVADLALQLINAGNENAESLKEYVKKYPVTYYVNGQEGETFGVTYGETVEKADLPTADGNTSKYTWYADADFETEFNFDAPVLGKTQIYGKYAEIVEETNGVFTSYDATYAYNENGTMTQTLKNSSVRQGLAEFNVEAGEDFYVSADLTLKNYMKVASQGWENGKNDRIGMALINENGENYRFQIRPTQLILYKYEGATALYNDENITKRTYLLGSTNGTSNEIYNKETPYLQLKNTSNMNSTPNISFAMRKLGNELTFYVNGEVAYTQEVAADFSGVPALLAYAFDAPATQVITYSNIVVKTGSDAQPWGDTFTALSQDYTATGEGASLKLTQALPTAAENGLAYFKVTAGADFDISMDIKLSGNPATVVQAAGDGADMRVGLAYINKETNENYRYLFRGTKCALIDYAKSTELYEMRAGSSFAESAGNVLYILGSSNSKPSSGAYVALKNTASINGSATIKLAYKKVGNQMSVYINGELVKTCEIEANFAGVPALLSYSLDNKTRNHTYSNIVIKTGTEIPA